MTIILLLTMIAVIVTVDFIMSRKEKRALTYGMQIAEENDALIYPEDIIPSPDIPKGFFYHQNHTWAFPGIDGSVMVGFDDLFQKFTGKIDAINVTKSEKSDDNGKHIEIQVGERTIKSNIPIKGELHSINTDLINDPGRLLNKCEDDGWIVKISPANLLESLKSFKTGSTAVTWMKSEFEKLQDTIPAVMNGGKLDCKTMADGGMLVYGVGKLLSNDEWNNIAAKFFDNK